MIVCVLLASFLYMTASIPHSAAVSSILSVLQVLPSSLSLPLSFLLPIGLPASRVYKEEFMRTSINITFSQYTVGQVSYHSPAILTCHGSILYLLV